MFLERENNNMKKERTWNLIGFICGIIIILIGILFATQKIDFSYSFPSAKDAEFGADYYTYQYSATRTVAQNTSATVRYLDYMALRQAAFFGFAFIVTGLLTTVHYGKKTFAEGAASSKDSTPAAVEGTVSEDNIPADAATEEPIIGAAAPSEGADNE